MLSSLPNHNNLPQIQFMQYTIIYYKLKQYISIASKLDLLGDIKKKINLLFHI